MKRRKLRRTKPLTMSITEAGREFFNLGPMASYQAAKAGHFPLIPVGKRYRVSVPALEKMIADAKPQAAAA